MKKLAQYSTMAGAFLSGISMANGEVLYTDFDPDKLVFSPNETIELFNVDVDADGIPDFQIGIEYIFQDSGWGMIYSRAVVYPLNDNNFGGINASDSYYFYYRGLAYKFESGDTIDADVNWLGYTMYPGLFYANYHVGDGGRGEWQPYDESKKKFLAVLLDKPDGDHYGWVRLTVDFHDIPRVVAFDAAYESEPGVSIAAGEMPSECVAPTILSPDISATSAKLIWSEVTGATHYKLQYKQAGPGSWTKKTIAAPKHSKIVTDLTCSTEYVMKVATSCDGGDTYSDFSDMQFFTTDACRTAENTIKPEITIYPNPASDLIYMGADGLEEGAVICIFNATGNLISTGTFSGDDICQINISTLNAGRYFIAVDGSVNTFVKL